LRNQRTSFSLQTWHGLAAPLHLSITSGPTSSTFHLFAASPKLFPVAASDYLPLCQRPTRPPTTKLRGAARPPLMLGPARPKHARTVTHAAHTCGCRAAGSVRASVMCLPGGRRTRPLLAGSHKDGPPLSAGRATGTHMDPGHVVRNCPPGRYATVTRARATERGGA
jgi:hypothetical protein